MTTVAGVGELGLLELIKPYLGRHAGGDDAAVLESGSPFTVVSTDMAVEGVHFDLTWMSAEDAGWRALALALGDLAAKGATPAWALTSVAMPRSWHVDSFTGLFAGIHALASKSSIAIEGGDMSAINGPAVISITVAGHADKEPLPRSAARPGWAIGVTGPLGGSAVALRNRKAVRLEPLLAEGRRLNAAGLCCGDISDGLVRELDKFAAMAGVGYSIEEDQVPVAAGATRADAVTSGEEVELVCVGPDELIRATSLHRVGVLTDAPNHPGEPTGYDHFA